MAPFLFILNPNSKMEFKKYKFTKYAEVGDPGVTGTRDRELHLISP